MENHEEEVINEPIETEIGNYYLHTELKPESVKNEQTEYTPLITELKQTEYENLPTENINEVNSGYFPIETEKPNNINYIPIATDVKYVNTEVKKEVKTKPKKSPLRRPDMRLDLNNHLIKNYLNSAKRKVIKEQYVNIVRKSHKLAIEKDRLHTHEAILKTEEKSYMNVNTEISPLKKKRRFLNTSVTIDETVRDRLSSVDNRKIVKYIKEENKIMETKESRTRR
jgi:hypothetical protein